MRRGKVEVFQGEDQQWYFRVVGGNGETMAVSESFPSKGNAKRAAKDLVDMTRSLGQEFSREAAGDEETPNGV